MPMKIRMVSNKQGYPARGETLTVSDDRAERWVLGKKIAEFVDRKDRVATLKKIEEREKENERKDNELARKLDRLDRGEPIDDDSEED